MTDYTIRRAAPADYEDLLDFGNYVFHIDFRALLPKLYGNHPELAADHVLVTEQRQGGERIQSMVGCFKIPLQVAGKKLLVRGIGTVSVHPYARGKGYMRLAMHRAIDDAQAEGTDMMVLSGRKQRYQHYGFEKCATQYEFSLSRSVSEQLHKYGVEGICGKVSTAEYTVLPVSEGKAYEPQCAALFASQPVYAQRENFFEVASSWSADVRVILKNGAFLGYGTISKAYGACAINELVLNDWRNPVPAVLALFDAAETDRAEIIAMPFQKELIHALTLIAEKGSISSGYGINVLNYPAVIEAFMQMKSNLFPLPDGHYVIDVIEKGKTEITVKDGKVSANPAPDGMEADIRLSHLQMMDFLFAPTGTMGVCGKQPALEKAWFPIPVCFSEQDNV